MSKFLVVFAVILSSGCLVIDGLPDPLPESQGRVMEGFCACSLYVLGPALLSLAIDR